MINMDDNDSNIGVNEEIYAILGHETRLKILLNLGELEGTTSTPVTFSTLRKQTGVRDSSKFNFHLRKLADQFLSHTEDGYYLTYIGRLIRRAILAGQYNPDHLALADILAESSCYNCGAALVVSYDDGRLRLRCTSCENLSYRITIPPSALASRDVETFLDAANQRVRTDIALLAKGMCPTCSGPIITERRNPSDAPTENFYVNHICKQSDDRILSTTIGELLLVHPGVVTFFYNHGIDLTEMYCWEIDFCVSDEYLTVISKDPWTIQFEYSLGDQLLRVSLNEEFAITDLSISPNGVN